MHAACLHEPTCIDSLLSSFFLCGKGELSFAVTAVVFWGICFVKRPTRSPIRRETKAHATSGCNSVLLDFRMVAERLCSTRSVIS